MKPKLPREVLGTNTRRSHHTPAQFSMSRRRFIELANEGRNLIPVWRELLADQETPVSAYQRIRASQRVRNPHSHSFLLESVAGGKHVADFSFVGGEPRALFSSRGAAVTITGKDEATSHELHGVDPLDALANFMSQYKPYQDRNLPRFFGGAVGYIGYDAVSQFEKRVKLPDESDLEWPDMLFCIADTVVIFQRGAHSFKIVASAIVEDDPGRAYDEALDQIDKMCGVLSSPLPQYLIDKRNEPAEPEFTSNMTEAEFKRAVVKAKEYIRAGDIIQVVLSQRFEVRYEGDPLDIHRALRTINPSPYMFCLEFGERRIVGSSPEIHVRCEDGVATVRPCAGSRPRGKTEEEDTKLERALVADAKDRAEHIMLVDLARNDLGRVCEYGSVKISERKNNDGAVERQLMVVEKYSHIMHLVSEVVGRLAEGRDVYDLMRCTFPAGTVSGAAKIRAMEIIAELEHVRRGPYGGAICYFSFTGNLDSSITIRTVLVDGSRAYVQAGAGIVADSDPQSEYDETRNKAKGMLKAIALAGEYAKARNCH